VAMPSFLAYIVYASIVMLPVLAAVSAIWL